MLKVAPPGLCGTLVLVKHLLFHVDFPFKASILLFGNILLIGFGNHLILEQDK